MRGREMTAYQCIARGSGSQQRPGLWRVFLKGQKMEREQWLGTEDFESGTVLGFGVTSRAGTVGHIVTHSSFVEQAALHSKLSSIEVIESTSKVASRCWAVCKHLLVCSICSVALKWTFVFWEVGCFVFTSVDFSNNQSPLLRVYDMYVVLNVIGRCSLWWIMYHFLGSAGYYYEIWSTGTFRHMKCWFS